MPIKSPWEGRFWEKVNKSNKDGCWEWEAAINIHGYGQFWAGPEYKMAHRIAYELLVGPIPTYHSTMGDRMELDHLCRNRLCVNPKHLEIVTHQENCNRSSQIGHYNDKKTHCPQGHEYSEENTYKWHNQRHCLACRQAANKKQDVKRKEQRKLNRKER